MKLKYISAVIATLFAAPGWGQLLPKMPAPSPTPVLAAPKPAPVLVAPVVTAPAIVVVPVPVEPVAKPALVAPALSGAISPVALPERKPELVAPTLPVTGAGLPVLPTVPPATAKAAEPAAVRGILLNPIATPSNLSGAKVDVSDVKQRIDTTGLKTGAPERKGGLADVARERNQDIGDDDKANKFRNKSGLIGSRVITGSDADTFAGEKINAKHTGDTGNFAGSRQGNAGGGTAGGGNRGGNTNGQGRGSGGKSGGTGTSNGSRDGGTSRSSLSDMGGIRGGSSGGGGGNEGNRGGGGGGGRGGGGKTSEDIATMLRMEGGTPTGDATKDTAELGYAQSVGSDGYAATKGMSDSERKAYWESQRQGQAQGSDTSRPREDDMGSGSRLVGTPQMKQQQLKGIGKAIAARKGAAGGGNDDPRVEQGGSGGPVRQVVGNDDKPQRSSGTGTLNLDKVLEINTEVNPTRQ